MSVIQREIEKYIHLLAQYPANKNAEEKFLNYQLALADLCELLDQYDPTPRIGVAPALTEDDLKRLKEGYSKAMTAGKDFQKFLTDSKAPNNANTQARNELIDSMYTMLDSDFTALSNVIGTDSMTLSEVLENSRGYQLDITGQNISKSGENMSSRIPISFKDKDGKEIKGFFTEEEVVNGRGDLDKLYQETIKDHPEYETVFRTFIKAQSFHNMFGDPAKAKVNLENFLLSKDTAHAFDQMVGSILTSEGVMSPKKAQAYIADITKDTTFATRVYDFCNNYAKLTFKHMVIQNGGKIVKGSKVGERNAAMSVMGDFLGVPNLVARSVKMSVIDNGKVKKGIFMEFAQGSDLLHLKKNDPAERVTPEGLDNPDAFKSIADLQVLDFVCGNVDRHGGNMFYKFEETPQGPKLTGVMGIDNDLSFGKVRPDNSDHMRMVDKDNMMVISESMANKIADMTPAMLEIALKDFSFSKKELQAAWERIDYLKKSIDEGAAYYQAHADEKFKWGHLRIVKDAEWNQFTLRELATRTVVKEDGSEVEINNGNYFTTAYHVPGLVDWAKNKDQTDAADKQYLKENHPSLTKPEQPFSIAKGKKLKELDPESIAITNREFTELQAEMKQVNTGFFVGSTQFNNVIKAFDQVKTLSANAAPDMSAKDIKRLHDAYEKLSEVTQIYLTKKEAEREAKKKQGKEPSDVAKERTAFARKLSQFTKAHEKALSNEYIDLKELNQSGLQLIGKRNATAKQVSDAATALLTGYALKDCGALCTRSQYVQALKQVKRTPGFDSFIKNTAQIKSTVLPKPNAQKKVNPARALQNKLWNHARLTLRENGPMEKPVVPNL